MKDRIARAVRRFTVELGSYEAAVSRVAVRFGVSERAVREAMS